LKDLKIKQLEEKLQKADFSKLSDEQIVKDIRAGRERTPKTDAAGHSIT